MRSNQFIKTCTQKPVRYWTIFFLGALLFSLCAIFPAAYRAQTTTTLDTEEQAFLVLINNYRQQNGLAPLQASSTLTNAAKWLSADMAARNYFSHTDSQGRDPFTRMASFGYNYNTYKGENIAAGYSDALSTFNQWKNSAGHNANMLNPNFKVIGIGRVANTTGMYRHYWTTDFGGYVDQTIATTGGTTAPTPTPTPTPTPMPSPTVTILNPGFESGLTNWITSGAVYRTTSYVTSGSYAALLYANLYTPASVFQWVQVNPGTTYELSARLRTDGRAKAILGVKWENYADGPITQYSTATAPVKVRFTVPAGTSKVGIYIKTTGTASGYAWTVADQVNLVRIN